MYRPIRPSRARPPSGPAQSRRATMRLSQVLACALLGTLAVTGLPGSGIGQPSDAAKVAKAEPNLEGAWSGGGEVAFATGSRERARCRAHYSRRSKDSYAMQATCATASGRAAQTATLRRVGENRFRGNFHNAEYDISGTVFVVVNGNSQSVRLTSSSGSALLRLTR